MENNKLFLESKIVAFGELGAKLDSSLEAARLENARYDGARQGLVEARKKLDEHLGVYVKKDLEENRLTMQEHALVSKAIIRCIGILENLSVMSEVQMHQSHGKIVALEQAVKQTKSMFDSTKMNYERILKFEENGGVNPRPEGAEMRSEDGHPGDPLADRRAEAALLSQESIKVEDTEVTEKQVSKRNKKRV